MRLFLVTILNSFFILTLGSIGYSQNKAVSKKDISVLLNKAVDNWKKDNYDTSIKQAHFALTNAIKLNNNYLIAKSYNVIGVNYDELFLLEKALLYYYKGLNYANKTNNDTLKGKIYNNLANIYFFEKKEFTLGLIYYKKSLLYSQKTHDNTKIFLRKINITWAFFETNDFKNGLPYLNYLNKYKDKYADSTTAVVLNMLNGMYAAANNNPVQAHFYFKKAIALGEKENEKFDLSVAYQKYAAFLAQNKNYKEAYHNIDKYNALTYNLQNDKAVKKAKLTGINLETNQYKREINTIESKYKNNQKALIEDKNKNDRISLFIISALLIIILLFYFFYQNARLKQKNSLKDVQSKIQRNIINASINGQEFERKKIAAFLHDNISALLSSADMHLTVLNSKIDFKSEELIKSKAILREAHDKVRDLSHELIPSLLIRFGLYYALQDLCEKNSNSSLHFDYLGCEDTNIRYDEDFETKMYFIITELLNNIIKHSQATQAKLSLLEKKGELIINIIDNGQGFDTRKFNITEGFGLNQIRARIKNMDGRIRIKSSLNSGTSVFIKTPIDYK